MPAQRIAIAAHKGGTGKTCTTLSCAAALARRGKRCLVIDLDPQGHSTLGLGLELKDAASLRQLLARFDQGRAEMEANKEKLSNVFLRDEVRRAVQSTLANAETLLRS